jgi:hypothetical protein
MRSSVVSNTTNEEGRIRNNVALQYNNVVVYDILYMYNATLQKGDKT